MKRFHTIFHILANYIVWLICLLPAAHGIAWTSSLAALLIVGAQYYWQYHVYHEYKGLNSLVVTLTLLGTMIDSTLLHFKLIVFSSNPFSPYLSPPWMIVIWINFAIVLYSTIPGLFKHFFLVGILSFFGFSASYAAGVKVGAALFPYGYGSALLIGAIWMLLLPTTLYCFIENKEP